MTTMSQGTNQTCSQHWLWASESPRLNPGWPLAGLRPLATFDTSLWRLCEKQSWQFSLEPGTSQRISKTFSSSSNGYFVMEMSCAALCSKCFTCITILCSMDHHCESSLIHEKREAQRSKRTCSRSQVHFPSWRRQDPDPAIHSPAYVLSHWANTNVCIWKIR